MNCFNVWKALTLTRPSQKICRAIKYVFEINELNRCEIYCFVILCFSSWFGFKSKLTEDFSYDRSYFFLLSHHIRAVVVGVIAAPKNQS